MGPSPYMADIRAGDMSKKFQEEVQKCTDVSVQEIELITKDKEQEIIKV